MSSKQKYEASLRRALAAIETSARQTGMLPVVVIFLNMETAKPAALGIHPIETMDEIAECLRVAAGAMTRGECQKIPLEGPAGPRLAPHTRPGPSPEDN